MRVLKRIVLAAGFVTVSLPAMAAGDGCIMGEALRQPESWKPLTFNGIEPNLFRVEDDGIVVRSATSASMLYADTSEVDFDQLTWRWASDGAMPATDLRRKGGDDRRLAISVAFDYRDPEESIFKRAMRGMMEAVYGAGLPGRVISYTWASSNAAGMEFDNPYGGEDAKTSILRTGDAAGAEKAVINPKADYRRLFGEAAPKISFIAVFADTDDTGATVTSRVTDLCLQQGS